MMGLSRLTFVIKVDHRPSISDIQDLNYGWITPTISTSNKTVVSLLQFVFLSQAKIPKMRKDE
jgi:hypothetical protein